MTIPQPTIRKISVLLVDDHQMLLDLWQFVLSRDIRFEVCGKATSGTIAVEMAKTLRPDIVLLDISIGPIDGFEVTRLIRLLSPASRIIGVSMYVLPAYAKKMKAMGAAGYVTKSSHADELFTAMLEVSKGNTYLCQQIRTIIDAQEKIYESDPAARKQLILTDETTISKK